MLVEWVDADANCCRDKSIVCVCGGEKTRGVVNLVISERVGKQICG